MVLGAGVIQRFLTNTLSAYFENVDSENLSVAVVSGDISLSNVQLKKNVMANLGFPSLRLVSGSVGSLQAKVPWTRFGAAPIVFELDQLYVLVEACDETLSLSAAADLLQKAMSEIGGELTQELGESQPAAESGWGGWLRSAGRLAKKFIDFIEVRIEIKNVHLRYTADLFTAGATLDSLSIATTTQQAAAKTLELTKLAFYCNPLEDAVEEISASTSDRQYVLEPLSGSVHLSFAGDLGSEVTISGDFDSVNLQFSREQLNTSIWAELKRILVSKAVEAEPLLRAAAAPPTPTPPTGTSKISVSLTLGRAVVRSFCLPPSDASDGSVDFVGEELFISGAIATRSEVKFGMSRLTVMNKKRRILSTNAEGIDFVQILLKTSDAGTDTPTDIVFKLGPVAFEFHPIVVGSMLAFLKSFPSSGGQAAPISGEAVGGSVISPAVQKLRLQFYWESMHVNWYQIASGRLFAKSRMTTSYIALDMFANHFVARGELGDFSIDHVIGEAVTRSLLGLANPDAGYLFKFYVRSFDELDTATFPGHFTQVEFDLSAVRLLVVRSALVRFWSYIFDGFLPAITGDLTAASAADPSTTKPKLRAPVMDEDEEDFRSVDGNSSESESELIVAQASHLVPQMAKQDTSGARRPYLLSVSIEALELIVPVSATAEETNPLRIELRRLHIKNQGAKGDIDIIDFDLQEVNMRCLDATLVDQVGMKMRLFREPVIRVTVSVEADIGIDLNRLQFCRLCDVLQNNILGNASDGVLEDLVRQADAAVSPAASAAEWMRFAFDFASIELTIDDSHKSRICLNSLNLAIVKFVAAKSTISVALGAVELSHANGRVGGVDSVTVQVDSEVSNRAILVSIEDPVLEVDLGIFVDLRSYFFDDFAPYSPPSGIVLNAVPDTHPEWETVLNVNLMRSKLVVKAQADSEFYVATSIFSFHQNFQHSCQRLCRKVVVSNAAVHFTQGAAIDADNLILSNLDLFLSMTNEGGESELVKFNCEPVNVRIGFSHLKELQAAADKQRLSLAAVAAPAVAPESGAVTASIFTRQKKNAEFTLSSISVLVVNDFAALQNTPLLNLLVRNVEITTNIVSSLADSKVGASSSSSSSSSAVVGKRVTRTSASARLDLAIAYFNKTSVSWEPLLEGQSIVAGTTQPGPNEQYVNLHARRTSVEFQDPFSSPESSSQFSFEVANSGGIQLNVTEALVQMVIENSRLWAAGRQNLNRQLVTAAAEERIVFSPYSVKNLTGEAIVVSWQSQLSFAIGNKEEVPLTGVTVLADSDASRRDFVAIEGDRWTIPRAALDKQGQFLFRVAGGELIAEIAVTDDGRKILTLQTAVLVKNEFGYPLKLKLSNTDSEYETSLSVDETIPIPISAVVHGHFRICPADGDAWSGSVSLADIRARNDSKLWQINSGGRFVYLSGAKRDVTYRDMTAVQMVVTVFAPVRIRSTVPAMIDFQVSCPAGRASGSIGLNGHEFVSAVPLTGKLELSLSLFEGECVSAESVQIWPIPADDLDQDHQGSYYLPVQFVSVREPGRPNLELKIYYATTSVKPPELTIHTSQWLVCLDVPRQLQFAYCDGVEDWASALAQTDSLRVQTPLGEKTYVAPLHARAKSIAAYLNKTQSEPVLVDTLGASGQITVDAFDESTKSRVKQDFAVRVSSVPSGVVRDLPVKITTVSPRFIVVNMLEAAVVVRQFGFNGSGTVANRGDQVAFRWWNVGPDDSVNRSLQLAFNGGGTWSAAVKVSEIGESIVEGIDNVRSEVRIYHGAFYLVLSCSKESVGVIPAPATAGVSNDVYQLVLPGLAVSVTGPVASRNVLRAEILLLEIKTLILNVSLSTVANELDLRMAAIQIDDLREESKFPVVFSRGVPSKRSQRNHTGGAVEVFASWLPPRGQVLSFESFLVRVADANICIDYSLISDLTDLFIRTASPPPAAYPFKFLPEMEILPVGSLRIWSFKEFLLNPLRVSLSFSPGSGQSKNFSVVHRAIASMAAVERSPLKLQALVLTKFRASRSNVWAVVMEHYKTELYREMRTIMGSAEAFGNPIGLIGSVSTGVSDLFHEPLSAIREMQGPEDVVNVADKTAKGAKSFFKNTTFGVFNSFSKLAATSAQTLSILTEDDDFIAERSDFNSKNRPSHVGDGMVVGAASFGRGILSGISGLVTKPVEGLEQDGIAGLAKGAVKGVGGFFLKPVAGLFDFAKSAADGVVSSTRDASNDSAHIRLPRMLYAHDRAIRVVNPEHSLLKWYLAQLESMPANFSYCGHAYDVQNGLLVAASTQHLVAADTNAKRLTLLVPLWRVLGVTTDLDRLVLSITVQVPQSRGTSKIDLELSSVGVVKSVQQIIANSMEF